MAAIGVPALANALLSTPPERPTPQAPSMPAPGLPNAAAAYAPPAPTPQAAAQTASAEVSGDQAVAAAQPEERAKTKGEVARRIVKELKAQGFSDNAIAGVLYNVNAESSFNPTIRHPDQPNFGGEAHFAHGLFQEGGDEWNTFASDQGRRANWQDPTEQTRYVAGRLKGDIGDKYYANVNRALQNAKTPEEAAKIFAVGYLKPAGPQLSGRMADINRGIPGLDAYTSSESGLPAPGSSSLGAPGERTGVQLAQAGGVGPGNYGGISREQLMALASNPLTADMAREIVMQRMTPKLIETGTNPLTGEKYFSQQIGNQLFPVQGGGGGGAGAQSLGAMYDNIARLQAQGASQQEMLQQVPSAYREGVSALIEGRALPANMGRGAARQQLLELAHTIDPTFDESKIPVRMKLRQDFAGSGKDGQAIQAFNTAQHHINKASDDLEVLGKYQGDYPSINALRAKMAQEGNRNPKLRDAIQAFNDDMQAVGKEVAHAYNSGHLGQHEMDQWNSLINSNLPPTQLRRGLADFTDLLNGKRDVMNDTYQSEFHTNAPLIEKGREENEMVTKKTHDRLEAALKGPTEPVSVRPANTAGMPHVRNKEEMDKLAPGTQFVAPDGSVWTKK
jgi:hypothetical protein